MKGTTMRFLSLALALTSWTALGQTLKPSGDINIVTWTAVGNPGFLTIEGTGSRLDGQVTIVDGMAVGAFEVDLRPIKTGITLRDGHMHEKYLETEKHPKAKLTIKPWKPTETTSKFEGTLTIKGVEKPVVGQASYKQGLLMAEFQAKLSDYPIGVPSWLGVTVAETVDVRVKARFE